MQMFSEVCKPKNLEIDLTSTTEIRTMPDENFDETPVQYDVRYTPTVESVGQRQPRTFRQRSGCKENSRKRKETAKPESSQISTA